MIWKEGSRSLKEYLPIKDADNFPHFPELSQEVQIKIWEHVCEIPGVVELGSAPSGSEKRRQNGMYPAALETCFLSRQIGFQYYVRLYSEYPIYVNLSGDILYFGKQFDLVGKRGPPIW
jgi:hypothetical protein